jgi:hypothetical protein
LSVVAVFFKLGAKSHPWINKIDVRRLRSINSLHFNDLFVDGKHKDDIQDPHIYHYKGSLTSPPCSDTVNWFICKDVKTITLEDLTELKSHWDYLIGDSNARHC